MYDAMMHGGLQASDKLRSPGTGFAMAPPMIRKVAHGMYTVETQVSRACLGLSENVTEAR